MANDGDLEPRTLKAVRLTVTIGSVLYLVAGIAVSAWLVRGTPFDRRTSVERAVDFVAGVVLWPFFLAKRAAG